jgi:hypothetical protein
MNEKTLKIFLKINIKKNVKHLDNDVYNVIFA